MADQHDVADLVGRDLLHEASPPGARRCSCTERRSVAPAVTGQLAGSAGPGSRGRPSGAVAVAGVRRWSRRWRLVPRSPVCRRPADLPPTTGVSMLDGRFKANIEKGLRPIGTNLRKTGITADHLTALGVVHGGRRGRGHRHAASCASACCCSSSPACPTRSTARWPRPPAPRRPAGAFFDSVSDRVSDSLLLGGVAWYLASTHPGHLVAAPDGRAGRVADHLVPAGQGRVARLRGQGRDHGAGRADHPARLRPPVRLAARRRALDHAGAHAGHRRAALREGVAPGQRRAARRCRRSASPAAARPGPRAPAARAPASGSAGRATAARPEHHLGRGRLRRAHPSPALRAGLGHLPGRLGLRARHAPPGGRGRRGHVRLPRRRAVGRAPAADRAQPPPRPPGPT